MATLELGRQRLERHFERNLDDVEIVEAMVLLLAKNPPVAAASEIASMMARVVFFDVARRWIPPEVVVEVFNRLELVEEVETDAR